MRTRRMIFGIFMAGVLYFFAGSFAGAQEWYGAVSYQMSQPRTDTERFIDNPSYLGWGLDFRQMVRENVGVGGMFAWNIFHERSSEPLKLGNGGTVTGLQDRTLNAFPIMANASYYFGQKGNVRPYLGLNLGGFVFVETFSVGILQVEDTRWDWGMAPEIGVVIPLNREFALLVSGRYYYAFTGESVVGKDINNAYASFMIGLAFEK